MILTPDEAAALDTLQDSEADVVDVALDAGPLREYIALSDMLKAREGEVDALKERKKELMAGLLSAFELRGVSSIVVDGRSVYTRIPTRPRYRDRPADQGGGRFGPADAVAALRAIGRDDVIAPETVNYQTLGAILREFQDADGGIPEPLADVVELEDYPEVRVGAPRPSRR